MFQFVLLASVVSSVASVVPVLGASHCDPGFVKERIENSADYICVKGEPMNDQDVLNELAELENQQDAETNEVENEVTLEDINVPFDIEHEVYSSSIPILEPERTDSTAEITESTPYLTSESAYPKNLEFVSGTTFLPDVSSSIEDMTSSTSTNMPDISDSPTPVQKFPARLSPLDQRLVCREGYEAHIVEGTADYECKPKSPGGIPMNQVDVEIERSSRKLNQSLAPQKQSGNSHEYECQVKTGDENCCKIRLREPIENMDYFKFTCKDNYALKKFEMIRGLPELECCKLPGTI